MAVLGTKNIFLFNLSIIKYAGMGYLDLYLLPDGSEIEEDNGQLVFPIIPIEKPKKSNGCTCIKCNEFNKYAEPNQTDGTFKCYYCRTYR